MEARFLWRSEDALRQSLKWSQSHIGWVFMLRIAFRVSAKIYLVSGGASVSHFLHIFFAVTARFSYVKLPNFPFYDNANLQRPGERLLTTTNLSFSFLNLMFFFRIKLQESSPSLDGVSESFLKWRFRLRWNRCSLPNSWYLQRAQLWSHKRQNKLSKLILWMNIFLPCLLFRTYSLTN